MIIGDMIEVLACVAPDGEVKFAEDMDGVRRFSRQWREAQGPERLELHRRKSTMAGFVSVRMLREDWDKIPEERRT